MELNARIKEIPQEPGVYLYYTASGELVYVGRATNLRSRVSSYFRGKRLSRPIEDMIHEVARIEWKQTESVIEGVILEAIYIKQFQPKYNVLGKDSKSWNYIVITKDEYPRIETIREHDLNELRRARVVPEKKYAQIFGPYPGLNMKAAQKILRRLFRFSTCEPGSKRPCLYYEMGQCLGVCIREISPAEYKKVVIRPLTWFLAGKKKAVIKEFEKQMRVFAKAENFEEAGRVRNQISSLTHIHDMTLIDQSFFENEKIKSTDIALNRIEGYDISNLGSTDKVGSMVVFNEHGPRKSEYRKFKIRGVEGQSDIDCLAEVIQRRLNHPEWQFPDAILIDGGRPQVNRVKKVFEERNINIPFAGIAKGPDRKRNDFILGSRDPKFVLWASKHRGLLIRVRDEAHRFAITFNRSKRKIKR
jgi:excinuclease ABC subunit C